MKRLRIENIGKILRMQMPGDWYGHHMETTAEKYIITFSRPTPRQIEFLEIIIGRELEDKNYFPFEVALMGKQIISSKEPIKVLAHPTIFINSIKFLMELDELTKNL